jgi:hypothetical protein
MTHWPNHLFPLTNLVVPLSIFEGLGQVNVTAVIWWANNGRPQSHCPASRKCRLALELLELGAFN